jgi:prolipoprotein diacylglyceryltransferase
VEGEVFCRMLMLLAAARLILEFFRGDDGRGFLIEPVLSIPQVISLLMLVTGLSLWWQLNQTSPKCPQQESGASSDLEKCL